MSDPAASTPPPAPAAEALSGPDLAASLLGATAATPAPETAATPAAVPAAVPPGPVLRDSLNREFDAKKYRTKPDGSPFLNARGHYMPRGGRKPGRATAGGTGEAPRVSFVPPIPEAPKPAATADAGSPGPVPPAPQPAPVNRSAMERTAEGYLRIAYLAADKTFDGKGEWKPDDAAEHAELKETLADHLTATNGQPLPSWAQFLVAAGIYILKRFERPNTAKTARYYWGKMNGAKPAQPTAEPKPAQPRAEFSPLTIEPLR